MASSADRDVHPPAERGDVSLTRASLVSVEMQRIGEATGGRRWVPTTQPVRSN